MTMTRQAKGEIVGLRTTAALKELAEGLAGTQGLTLSEYVRNLIISDLDRRSVFTDTLKKELGIYAVPHTNAAGVSV